MRLSGRRALHGTLLSLLVFLILSTFSSCTPTSIETNRLVLCEDQKGTTEGIWAYGDSLYCEWNENQVSRSRVQIFLSTEVAEAFPYANLYVKCRLVQPDQPARDTLISIDLIDHQGYWIGEKKGNSYTQESKIWEFETPQKGSYFITVVQNTRSEVLPGVEKVSMTVVR